MGTRSSTLALRISLIYGVIAALWVLLSSKWLHWLVPDPVIAANLETYKDQAFVLVTALLLFFTVRRQLAQIEREIAERKRASESLALFRALLNHSSDGIEVVDPATGRLLDVNLTICQDLGYTRDEMLALTVADIDVSVTPAKLVEVLARLREFGSLVTEGVHRRKNGTTFPVELNQQLVPLDREYIVTIVRNISRRKQEADALRNSEQLLRLVMDLVPHFIFVKDKDSRHLLVNRACAEAANRTAEQMVGLSDRDMAPGSIQAEAFILDDQEVITTGRPKFIEEKLVDARGQIRILHTTKIPFPSSTITFPIPGNGKPAILGVSADITTLKQVESQLAESRNYLDKIINCIADPIFVKDRQHRWVLVNHAFCDFTGHKREELLGKSDRDFFPSHEADVFWANDEMVFNTREENINEERFTDRKGNTHIIVTKKALYTDEKGQQLIVGVIRNVTELKRKEERLKRLTDCFLSFGTDPMENINRLIRLCGELLGATCTLYNRLNEGGLLCSLGQWNTPPNFAAQDKPEGHLCHDVIRKAYDKLLVVRNLPETPYFKTDPNVARYRLQTYVGKAVRFSGATPGSLCVVFQRDFEPDAEDERLINIVAAAIGIEESRRQAQSAVQESEERLHEVVTHTHCILNFGTVEGPDGWRENALNDQTCFRWHFPVLNEEAAQIVLPLELAPGENYQRAWTRSRNPADHHQMNRNSGNAFLHDAPFYRNEFRCTDKFGAEHWMQQFVTVRKLAENRWQIFGITTDISDLKRAEEELRKNEAFLGSIVENIPNMLFVKDAKDLRFAMFNKAGAELIGRPRSELIGKSDAEVFPPEQAASFTEKDREALHQRTMLQIAEEEMTTLSQGKRIMRTKKIPIFDQAGQPEYLLGISEDITERRLAEEANKRLATAVDQAAEDIIITDAQGMILYVNPAFEKLTGYHREEVIGKNPRILKSGKHEAAYYQRMWSTLAHGEVWSGRIINKKKDGTLFELEATISPIRDANGRTTNYVGVRRDVTREAALEAQLRQSQKMDAIGKLAGGVAHDFNNLLTVISGNVSLLQMQDIGRKEQTACLDDIAKASDRAATLTRQLLQFSRKQDMQARDLNLNEVVSNITKMLQRVLGEHIQMQLKFASRPLSIHADPAMMDQILLNLAVNSRDAMPAGGRLIIETTLAEFDEASAAQSPQARPGTFACLSVSDTGSGIAPENLPRIFEPFFTTKDVGRGTGLGLATVFGIVQQHGGWITAYSQVGSGTTFRVYFPHHGRSAQSESAAAASSVKRGSGETILVVEDDALVRKLVHNLLAGLGYRVLEADNGITALEVWKHNTGKIHLLLTDVIMPQGINGKNLAEQLLRDDPQLKVIYTSGYSAGVFGPDFPLQEGTNYLTKPFEAHSLAQAIRSALNAGKKT